MADNDKKFKSELAEILQSELDIEEIDFDYLLDFTAGYNCALDAEFSGDVDRAREKCLPPFNIHKVDRMLRACWWFDKGFGEATGPMGHRRIDPLNIYVLISGVRALCEAGRSDELIELSRKFTSFH